MGTLCNNKNKNKSPLKLSWHQTIKQYDSSMLVHDH